MANRLEELAQFTVRAFDKTDQEDHFCQKDYTNDNQTDMITFYFQQECEESHGQYDQYYPDGH